MFNTLGFTVLVAWGGTDTGRHWVTGGQAAQPDSWPSIVSVQSESTHRCSGVLVAPTLVLTAGHCNGPHLDTVFVGGTDLWDFSTGEVIAIAERVQYPESWRTYDVTILVLAEPAIATPTPIARACALDHLEDGATVELVGFGATDVWGTQATHVLMQARTTIQDADCSSPEVGCNSAVSPGGELIAGGDGVDSCAGDSGGPLYLWTPWGQPVLAGLTSRATSPADTPCGEGGIYVRMDAIADWVESTSEITLIDPDCDKPPIVVREPDYDLVGRTDTGIDTGITPSEPVGGCGCAPLDSSRQQPWIVILLGLLAWSRSRYEASSRGRLPRSETPF